ncbi:hypothetical protein Trydic_g10547 [Trypoxylus dichotomus]
MKVSCAAQVLYCSNGHGIDDTDRSKSSEWVNTGQVCFRICTSITLFRQSLRFSESNELEASGKFLANIQSSPKGHVFSKRRSRRRNSPTISQKLVKAINGLKAVYSKIAANGITYIRPRDFNQDPVENFFGQIRQQSVRDTNTTCAIFT